MKKHSAAVRALVCAAPLPAAAAAFLTAKFVLENVTLPPCPTYTVTGICCPGCGLTRSVRALISGDILLSLRQNALVVICLLAALAYYAELVAYAFGRPFKIGFLHNEKTLWLVLAALTAYTLARNIFPQLAPI